MSLETTVTSAAARNIAQNQTAATANTNPQNDTARSAQTALATDTATPVTAKQVANLKAAAVPSQPEAVVLGGPPFKGPGGGRGSYAGYNAADEVKNKVKLAAGNNSSKTYKDAPNPLDQYSSYTYGISLHVLSKDSYNAMVKSPKNFKVTKTLISSAGRYRNQRDVEFKDDFYFDDLKFDTVIGLNANTRGTNALKIEFTIVEPYGLTLLDRIMNVNNDGLNGKNYLDMPYLLELNFFGADDTGAMKQIHNQTKWFPIKIIGFKIKASVKGSTYAVEAIPFNHGANLESIQSIKTRMEISATTVGDYFSNVSNTATQDSVNAAIAEDEKRKAKPDPKEETKTDSRKPAQSSADSASTAPIVVKATSFVAAYNAWFQAEQKNGNVGFADQIQFVFDETTAKEITSSKIVDAKKNSVRRVAATTAQTAAAANSGADATANDFNSIIHDLEAGTTVNDIINLVLPQSEYFLKQAMDSATENKETTGSTDQATAQEQAKTVKLWKIIPSIELKEFDPIRNEWGKVVTFHVSTYDVYQNRDDRLPKSPPPAAVKKYEYFYTGHNNSVINFDIDFNALYFTAKVVDRGKTTAATGASQKPEDQQLKDKSSSVTNPKNIQQDKFQPIANDYGSSAGGATSRSETLNAQSALQSIYTSAAGDMINLKLQIIGDPEFIKQDDLFISPAVISANKNTNADSRYVTGTGSLAMDSGEIFCTVTFKTPTDFNDATGLYDLNSGGKYKVSEFSGFYKVIKVTNEFRGGKFTQTLELIRQPAQDSPNNSKNSGSVKSIGDTNRQDDKTKESKKAAQHTSNPQVPSSNVVTPTNTQEVFRTPLTRKGPDNTAEPAATVTKTNASVLAAIGTAAENKLSEVAKQGQTVDISRATPSTGDPVIAPPAP